MIDASKLLRPGLLDGLSLSIAGAGGSLALAVRSACVGLGASVAEWQPAAPGPPIAPAESGPPESGPPEGQVDLLVVDGGWLFSRALARAGEDDESRAPRVALRACLEGAWEATHAIAGTAFLGAGRPGRIVYLAPAPDAGPYADAARAGLENLARTLSIEWARHHVTTVTIAPSGETGAGELAVLIAYLASPAGAYFSGCLLDLRGSATGQR